jgi:hypothetical protein
MAKIKITGLDNAKKQLEKLNTTEFLGKALVDKICEKVPEAEAERHKFKFDRLPNGNITVSADGISPELYAKIMRAFEQ